MIKKIDYSFIHNSFIVFLFLLFTEGILRKWFTNSFSIELILLRDSIVVITLIYALKNEILIFTKKLEKILLLITLLIIFWSLLQLIITQTTVTISIIGLRNWLIFYWFVVIFYKSLKSNRYKSPLILICSEENFKQQMKKLNFKKGK